MKSQGRTTLALRAAATIFKSLLIPLFLYSPPPPPPPNPPPPPILGQSVPAPLSSCDSIALRLSEIMFSYNYEFMT